MSEGVESRAVDAAYRTIRYLAPPCCSYGLSELLCDVVAFAPAHALEQCLRYGSDVLARVALVELISAHRARRAASPASRTASVSLSGSSPASPSSSSSGVPVPSASASRSPGSSPSSSGAPPPSATPSPTRGASSNSASQTPFPTTIATTRNLIDLNNLTFTIMSDRPFVNVGARNDYGDGFGTLVSTAVLVRTPASGAGGLTWGYRASRVDLLMAGPSGLGVTRGIADFFVTLFSDDGSAAHNPAAQLSSPYLLSAQTAPLLTFRASWYQQDISSAGWPLLSADTYYWIVVTPGSPLTMPNGQYNGALWSGISASQTSPFDGSQVIPPSILNDPVVFTARELTSERFQGDYSFGAGTVAAVSFLAGSSYWPSAPNAIPRFTNFAVSPPNGQPLRYGVQLIGWQVPPSSSPAPGCEYCVVCLSVRTRVLTCPRSSQLRHPRARLPSRQPHRPAPRRHRKRPTRRQSRRRGTGSTRTT